MRFYFLFLVLFLGLPTFFQGQEVDTLSETRDTTPPPTVLDSLLQMAGVDSLNQVNPNQSTTTRDDRVQASDTSFIARYHKLEELSKELNELERLLHLRYDTTSMRREILAIDSDIETIEYMFDSYPDQLNYNALNAIYVVLERVIHLLEDDQKLIVSTYNDLLESRHSVLTLLHESTAYSAGSDSLLQEIFTSQLAGLSSKWESVMNDQRRRILNLAYYQNLITTRYIKAGDLIAQTEANLKNYQNRVLHQEYPVIWDSHANDYHFNSRPNFQQSLSPIIKVLTYFIQSRWGLKLILIVFSFMFYLWIRNHVQHIRGHSGTEASQLSPLKYIDDFPILSSMLVGIIFLPILHNSAPALYLNLLWVITGTIAYPILRRQWPSELVWLWDSLFVLFIVIGLNDLQIFPTLVERWLMLGLTTLCFCLGFLLFKNVNRLTFSYPRLLRYVTLGFLVLQVISIFLNIAGWFTISKILSTGSLTSLFYAFILTAFVKIIMEAMYLQGQRNEKGSRFSFWFKYQDIEKRLRTILLFLAIITWMVITLKNGSIFDYLVEIVADFLQQTRYLGNFEFTWGSLLTFMLVLWFSSALSQIIKYFFGTPKDSLSAGVKNNLANYMLIIRLVILAAGFMLALSAAGIPLDKVAIVVGALGVGIGFGLQNIVNNLVSGVILAFERPIQIGDIVQFGTETGKVKEIGIRASKIATFEGADIIVPNGDLLSGQITNWTISDNNRRIELIIGVGYHSDIDEVKATIKKVLDADKEVLSIPPPNILVRELNSSSVDFRVLFWTGNIDNWITLKSNILGNIFNEMRKAGIEIPFPKRDVTLKFEGNGKAEKDIKNMVERPDEKNNLLKQTTKPDPSKPQDPNDFSREEPAVEPAEDTSDDNS